MSSILRIILNNIIADSLIMSGESICFDKSSRFNIEAKTLLLLLTKG